MRNDEYLKTLLKRGKRFVKRAACFGLAGYMLVVGSNLIAQATSLADVFDAKQYADDYLALYEHYQTIGKTEGRTAKKVVTAAPKQESTTTSQASSQSSSISGSGSASGNSSLPGSGSTFGNSGASGSGSMPEGGSTPGTGSIPEGGSQSGAHTETIKHDDGSLHCERV